MTLSLRTYESPIATLRVNDPRGLLAKIVKYLSINVPSALSKRSDATHPHRPLDQGSAQRCVLRNEHDARSRRVARWDARLYPLAETDASVQPNQAASYSLTGAALNTRSVDAGWRRVLINQAGLTVRTWDSRGTQVRVDHDLRLRPVAVFEKLADESEHCVERLRYAEAHCAADNLCGQLIEHDDPAGRQHVHRLSIAGGVQVQSRRFLLAETSLDWPVSSQTGNELLEPEPAAVTHCHFSALAELLTQTDAKGNRQRLIYDAVGRIKATRLQLAGHTEHVLLASIRYNAFGQVEEEVAGNGVRTLAHYSPIDGRLNRLRAGKPGGPVMQDLTYTHDPVGNILSIRDDAQPVRHFNNQRIEPVSTYRYDTLYQLIEATGRETASPSHGPALPDRMPSPVDANQLANYTQTFTYDAGGNLTTLRHVGARSFTREMDVAALSNRSVIKGELDLDTAFDGNGNLLQLQPGQRLEWDARNQLRQVTPVQRASGDEDCERYIYNAAGQRIRKVRSSKAHGVTHRAEVRYLPGLELRTDTATGENLHVVSVTAGSGSARVLHWEAGKPDGIDNDQIRYSLSDHLGSNALELDAVGAVISQEGYYPYGGTAWQAGRNDLEAKYKTIRYSGKERDATGLYYYGFRYYASWLYHWLSPDPAGDVSGLNLYRMVVNNPISRVDADGLMDRPPPVASRPHSTLGPPPSAARPPPVPARPPPLTPRPASAPSGAAVAPIPALPAQTLSRAPTWVSPLQELVLDESFTPGAFLEDVSSSYETTVHTYRDNERIVIKDYSSMLALNHAEVQRQKAGAANEVFAYRLSQTLALDLVPATTLRPGSDREVVSRYVDVAAPPPFDRRQSSLYVFDYLLNTRDRLNAGENVIFDASGKPFAIDHQSILEPGYVDITLEDIGPVQMAAFLSNPDTAKRLMDTDWDMFFEVNGPAALVESRNAMKSLFVERINHIRQKATT